MRTAVNPTTKKIQIRRITTSNQADGDSMAKAGFGLVSVRLQFCNRENN